MARLCTNRLSRPRHDVFAEAPDGESKRPVGTDVRVRNQSPRRRRSPFARVRPAAMVEAARIAPSPRSRSTRRGRGDGNSYSRAPPPRPTTSPRVDGTRAHTNPDVLASMSSWRSSSSADDRGGVTRRPPLSQRAHHATPGRGPHRQAPPSPPDRDGAAVSRPPRVAHGPGITRRVSPIRHAERAHRREYGDGDGDVDRGGDADAGGGDADAGGGDAGTGGGDVDAGGGDADAGSVPGSSVPGSSVPGSSVPFPSVVSHRVQPHLSASRPHRDASRAANVRRDAREHASSTPGSHACR